jgi:hypothetical protein
MSQFKVYKSEAEWEASYLVLVEKYKKEGVKITQDTEGPQQYPCLAADTLLQAIPGEGHIMYAYVYAGDCVDLLKAVDPTELHKNLVAVGRMWAADMVKAGYVDGDGPARFITEKLFSNLWAFLQDLRVSIPAWSTNDLEQERGIDSVILLETLLKRCTEDGHDIAEKDVRPLLDQIIHMAECDDYEDRQRRTQQIAMQVRQLQALAVAAQKKGADALKLAADRRVSPFPEQPNNEVKPEYVVFLKRKVQELEVRLDAEDTFRRDIAAKVMAVWDVLTSTKNFPVAEKILEQSYFQAQRTIDEDVTQRKDEKSSSGGDDE